MTDTYTKNKILTLNATVIPQDNITISIYEWKINNSIILDNLSSVSINTNDLNLGDNTISLRVKNSCGSWSEYVTKTVNIINETIPIPDEVINMEQTITIVVDKPITTIDVIMQLTGSVVVTVKNPLEIPIANAITTIDTVTATTDALGIATLNGIGYGTKTLTVTTT